MAILGGFNIDNIVDSGLDVLRWIGVNVDVGVLKVLVAIVSAGVQRALGSDRVRFRWDYGTP